MHKRLNHMLRWIIDYDEPRMLACLHMFIYIFGPNVQNRVTKICSTYASFKVP